MPPDLGVEDVTAEEAYEALNTLLEHKGRIEAQLAQQRLDEGALVLYDVTSVVMEGTECPLADYGYSRDDVRGKLQIEIGLATDAERRPVAVEVFEGDTANPQVLSAEIARFQQRLGLERVINWLRTVSWRLPSVLPPIRSRPYIRYDSTARPARIGMSSSSTPFQIPAPGSQ